MTNATLRNSILDIVNIQDIEDCSCNSNYAARNIFLYFTEIFDVSLKILSETF